MHDADLVVDPLAYLEQVIKDCTCEWCERVYPEPVKKQWIARVAGGTGYTSTHKRYWRVCAACTSSQSFGTWVFPAIANMPNLNGDVMDAIISVQPMCNHDPHFEHRFYMQKNRAAPAGQLQVQFQLDYRFMEDGSVKKTTLTTNGREVKVLRGQPENHVILDDP